MPSLCKFCTTSLCSKYHRVKLSLWFVMLLWWGMRTEDTKQIYLHVLWSLFFTAKFFPRNEHNKKIVEFCCISVQLQIELALRNCGFLRKRSPKISTTSWKIFGEKIKSIFFVQKMKHRIVCEVKWNKQVKSHKVNNIQLETVLIDYDTLKVVFFNDTCSFVVRLAALSLSCHHFEIKHSNEQGGRVPTTPPKPPSIFIITFLVLSHSVRRKSNHTLGSCCTCGWFIWIFFKNKNYNSNQIIGGLSGYNFVVTRFSHIITPILKHAFYWFKPLSFQFSLFISNILMYQVQITGLSYK